MHRAEFLPSLFRVLESWLAHVRLCFSHLWESAYALIEGDSRASSLCVVFGRWRASPPKEEVIAAIIDLIQRTKDPDLIEGLGLLLQKACLDPDILSHLRHIAFCVQRIDRLDGGPVLYALRVEREANDLVAGEMSPRQITCSPIDLLKHLRAELLSCNGIPTTYRTLLVMRELERAALETIDRDQKLSIEEKRHLREEIMLADGIAYASWAERQVSEGAAEQVMPQGFGVRGRLLWGVN